MIDRLDAFVVVLFLCAIGLGQAVNAAGLPGQIPCAAPLSGDWKFGTAPTACRVNELQSAPIVELEYRELILQDRELSSGGREKYMSSLYPVLRDTAKYYIHRRNPRVSPAEEEAFTLAFLTLVHQESVWSHYRRGVDGIVRFMRGDSLHGFGLMQIDDRSHAVNIKAGKGADLVSNIVYGLDIYYAGWIKATSVSCVPSESDYRSRARAAWSAYNGGPGAICRWANRRLTPSAPDNMYNKKYDDQKWNTLVGDRKAPSSVNVACLVDGKRPCAQKSSLLTENLVAKVEPLSDSRPTHRLAGRVPYRMLRTCPAVDCPYERGVIRVGTPLLKQRDSNSGWALVSRGVNGPTGWIQDHELSDL